MIEDAKSVIRKTMPVAQRVLGNDDEVTLRMRVNYAQMVCKDANATFKNLNEAVDTLEEIEPTARRALGSAHPLAKTIGNNI